MDRNGQRTLCLSLVVPLSVLAALLVGGCGAGGGTHGGADNLPSAKTHPFTMASEPALQVKGVDVSSPSIALGRGGEIWMWVVRENEDKTREIARYSSLSGLSFEEDKLEPFQADPLTWEGESLQTAHVIPQEEGYSLLYLNGAGTGIGIAASTDGETWSREESNPFFAASSLPEETARIVAFSGLFHAGDWHLWCLTESMGFVHGLKTENGDWDLSPMELPQDFDPEVSEPGLWEKDGVSSFHVQLDKTPIGRTTFRMWYGGVRNAASGMKDGGIGFAGSEDGVIWTRSTQGATLYNSGFGEKMPFFYSNGAQERIYYARYWRKEGDNRHVIGVATYDPEKTREE